MKIRGVARNLFWGGIKLLNSCSDVVLPHKKFTWADFFFLGGDISRYPPVATPLMKMHRRYTAFITTTPATAWRADMHRCHQSAVKLYDPRQLRNDDDNANDQTGINQSTNLSICIFLRWLK